MFRLLKAANHMTIRLVSLVESALPGKISEANDWGSVDSERSAIVVTTFAPRFFSHALPTIQALRRAGVTNEIFVVINGDQGGRFDAALRGQFLSQLATLDNVNPVCLGTGRGMAEMWNIGARTANAKKIILLNEDLIVSIKTAEDCIRALESALDENGLVILNESFGHFGVTKAALMRCNWFDERFLGFGEEDGDFIWRYEKEFGIKPGNLYHSGLNNAASKTGYENIVDSGRSKYSQFNYAFLREKYEFVEGPPEGTFSRSAKLIFEQPQIYSSEMFRENFEKLMTEKQDEEELRTLIRNFLNCGASGSNPTLT